MNKVKKYLLVYLFMLFLGVNVINISPLGEPPGWNDTRPMSEITQDVEL